MVALNERRTTIMSIETNRRDALAGAAVSGLVASVWTTPVAAAQSTGVMATATEADYKRDPTRWGSADRAATIGPRRRAILRWTRPTRTRRSICRCFCFGALAASRQNVPRNSLTYGDATHQTSLRTRQSSVATIFKKRCRTKSSNTSRASSKRKEMPAELSFGAQDQSGQRTARQAHR